MQSSPVLLSDHTPAPRPDWIDALAFRGTQIGKWNPHATDFWPRLANLAFHAVLYDRYARRTPKPRWHTPLSPAESFAIEHLIPRLLGTDFVHLDDEGRPDLDILATKTFWQAAYTDLPRACCAPEASSGDRRGRWFVNLAAALAETLADQGDDWSEPYFNRYPKLDRENRFLCSRLYAWQTPAGPSDALRSSGVEFIHYILGPGSTTAAFFAKVFETQPRLHSGRSINWLFGVWLNVGWRLGLERDAEQTRRWVSEMSAEQAPENLAYTHDLLTRLLASAPEGVNFEHIIRGAQAYIKERHGLVRDGHGPEVCVHALDYGFFMAAGQRGLLPPRPVLPAPQPEPSSTHVSS